MSNVAIDQHQVEIQENLQSWNAKPLLQTLYAGFYDRIAQWIDPAAPGRIVEIGSGIGNLKSRFSQAITSDLFPNPWLDVMCDGYEMPWKSATVSHLILFDVFHHLEAPRAFFREAGRVLTSRGRVIILDPFISLSSWPAYGIFHHEPVAWGKNINLSESFPRPRSYYAAQGNATRLFFNDRTASWLGGWTIVRAHAFAAFSYLLSGGFSKRALYPAKLLPAMKCIDKCLSGAPKIFGGRCLIVLEKN